MHQKYQCTSSQGLPGLGYGPLTASGLAVTGWEAIVDGFPPRPLPRMWCHTCHTEFLVDGMCGVMSPHMSYSGGIKVVAPLFWGVLLPLSKTENLSTPPASWVTMIPPRSLPRHPCSFNKLQVKPAESRNVILLTTRSCHIFLMWPNRNCPLERSASASSINPHMRPSRTVYRSARYQFLDLQDFG